MSESSQPTGRGNGSESSGAPRDVSEASARIREIFERFRLPGFDVDAYIAARQADIDAVSRATSVAFAGAQTITQKQAELLKTALSELSDALKSRGATAEGANAEEVVNKQRDLVQNTLSRTLAGMKEMAEAAQNSQAEIFDIALERVRSNAEQLRSLFITEKR